MSIVHQQRNTCGFELSSWSHALSLRSEAFKHALAKALSLALVASQVVKCSIDAWDVVLFSLAVLVEPTGASLDE